MGLRPIDPPSERNATYSATPLPAAARDVLENSHSNVVSGTKSGHRCRMMRGRRRRDAGIRVHPELAFSPRLTSPMPPKLNPADTTRR